MKILIIILSIFTQNVDWKDDITNPENEEYVIEVAFNLDKDVDQVTQKQFNKRYLK